MSLDVSWCAERELYAALGRDEIKAKIAKGYESLRALGLLVSAAAMGW
jgi:hypothetical protein